MPSDHINHAGERVTFVPLTIKRRHTRKLLIEPGGDAQRPSRPASFDLVLLSTLGKAFYWQSLLDSGEVRDGREIATRFSLDKGWVNEVLRMTLLAPDIVSAIHEGKQPRQLNLHVMRGRGADVPHLWAAQRELFGLSPLSADIAASP